MLCHYYGACKVSFMQHNTVYNIAQPLLTLADKPVVVLVSVWTQPYTRPVKQWLVWSMWHLVTWRVLLVVRRRPLCLHLTRYNVRRARRLHVQRVVHLHLLRLSHRQTDRQTDNQLRCSEISCDARVHSKLKGQNSRTSQGPKIAVFKYQKYR